MDSWICKDFIKAILTTNFNLQIEDEVSEKEM